MKKNESDFINHIFQLYSYSYYVYPLCQSILVQLIHSVYIKKCPSQSYLIPLKEDLKKYIEKSRDNYNYHKTIQDSFRSFREKHYPRSPSAKKDAKPHMLTKYIQHNTPIDTFGHNFTFNFYRYSYCENYFDNCNNIIRDRWLTPREFILNKVKAVKEREKYTTSSYTLNFLQAKAPDNVFYIPYTMEDQNGD